MKTTSTLLKSAVLVLLISIAACKKENTFTGEKKEEQESTFEISTGQALADNTTEDANSIFIEAAASKNLLDAISQSIITPNNLSGVPVSVAPVNGFPKTITINFGNGYTGANGVTRKGKITAVLSDFIRKTGSTATITFEDYVVNGYKREGTITWTNTSTAAAKGWQRKIQGGKITGLNGQYWLHNGIKDAVQIAGANTPNTLMDDAYLITGNHTITNAAGQTKTFHITTALEKKAVCENIGTGVLKIDGGNQTAVIDFGNGNCDKTATITINNGITRTITLQ